MAKRLPVDQQHRFDHLTWEEINEAVKLKKVVILPVGTIQQHGPHLPVDTDELIVTSLALAAGERRPEKMLVAPTIPYSYCLEAIDFPGTVSVASKTFMSFCVSVVKGFAYHGFDHILLLNGFPPNDNLIELVARQINLETEALCASTTWTSLLRVNPDFNATWRESDFPGSAHADELETSLYLALDAAAVDMSKAVDEIPPDGPAPFVFEDHFGGGSIYLPAWTSIRTASGVMGQPTKASLEKGQRIFEEAVSQFLEVITEFQERPKRPRQSHHAASPLGPLPLGVS